MILGPNVCSLQGNDPRPKSLISTIPATFDRRPLRLILEPFKVGPKLAEVGVNHPQKVHFKRVTKKRLMKKIRTMHDYMRSRKQTIAVHCFFKNNLALLRNFEKTTLT